VPGGLAAVPSSVAALGGTRPNHRADSNARPYASFLADAPSNRQLRWPATTHGGSETFTDARVRTSNGDLVGMIGVNIDVTQREEAEAARSQAEARRELLVAELNHRLKNTLSVVQAIANQIFRGMEPGREPHSRAGSRRSASSHDLLTKCDWTNA